MTAPDPADPTTPPPALRIRRARPDDVPAVVALATALFAEDAGANDPAVDTSWPVRHGAARFAEGVADPSKLVLLAERGEGTAAAATGYLSATLSEPTAIRPHRTAVLLALYVAPAHRRARTGERLVEAFREWAAESGAAFAEVEANHANQAAVRFYTRTGFAPQYVTLRAPVG